MINYPFELCRTVRSGIQPCSRRKPCVYLNIQIMNEPFNLSIVYKGEERELKARFERWGYTHRIAVLISETTVTFEPDEEGGYRALAEQPVDAVLLRTVAEKLAKISNND